MQVASDRFGELDIDDDRILQFDDGLLGFPEARRFAMLDTNESGLYFWLQSLDDPGLAFLSVVPWQFFPDYEPDIGEVEQSSLGLSEADQATVLCLLTVQREPQAITANLMGPLVINTATRKGRQVVLADSGYPVRAPWRPDVLVLTRRANQSIVIGQDVVVTVLEVRGDQVRLGINAPRDVTVHREEVYAEIQRENREAAMRSDVPFDLPLPSAPAARPGPPPAGPPPGRKIPPPPPPRR